MAEFDDERPPRDDRSAEPPETGTGGLRRFPPRERGAGDPYGDEGTGEVPRPPAASRDDDLGFDDLDDEPPSPPRPRSSRGRSSGGAGGRRPPRGRSRSGRGGDAVGGGAAALRQPRMRLALAIAFAAILILVIVLVVRDCQRSQLEDSYTSYLNDVSAIVATSAEQGKQLRQIMNKPRSARSCARSGTA
jgi:hypothetical protein